MTVDVGTSATFTPGADLNAALSWRSLPYDPEFAKTTFSLCSIGILVWTFLLYWGSYHHPIPGFLAKRMSEKDKYIWRYRVVNAYHGASSSLLSLYWYYAFYTTEYSRKNTYYELIMLANTGGYLLMDTVFLYTEGFLDTGNLIHHFFGVSVYYAIAYFQHDYTFMAMHLLPGEFSNVAMHGREIIKRQGQRYTWLYYVNDYTYYFEYLVCRLFWIPSIYYFIFTCPTSNPVSLIIYPMHVAMSWYYCSHIPGLIVQRYKEIKKIQNNGLKIEWFEPIEQAKLTKIGVTGYEAYHT